MSTWEPPLLSGNPLRSVPSLLSHLPCRHIGKAFRVSPPCYPGLCARESHLCASQAPSHTFVFMCAGSWLSRSPGLTQQRRHWINRPSVIMRSLIPLTYDGPDTPCPQTHPLASPCLAAPWLALQGAELTQLASQPHAAPRTRVLFGNGACHGCLFDF